jgi:hypothetical protein
MEYIIINKKSYQIDDEYFVKNLKKSVSFSDDCKTYDNASQYNNLFGLLCKRFFHFRNSEESISNSFGVLNFLANSDIDENEKFLVYALNEINVIVLNLISLKSKILLDNSTMSLSKTIKTQENFDPFWDQSAFDEIATRNKNNYKVPICRKGNRQFGSALGPDSLDAAKVLRNILKETLEWYN